MNIFRISIFFSVGLSVLNAAPAGFELLSGSATSPIETSPNHTLIESSGNAVIAWDSFSVLANETLVFQQASQESYVLNQVMGNVSSDILGSLHSNGSVYLINPNGIFIGPDAFIETAGFLASTLDLCKEKMAEGIFAFAGESQASIVNQGTIHASNKEIYLIAKHIDNQGTLNAPSGTTLLATCDILIEKEGSPQILIRPSEPLSLEEKGLLAEQPYAFAIRHSGSLYTRKAHLLSQENILVEGLIDTSSPERGGTIKIEGNRVAIAKEAHLLADAKEQGDGGAIFLLGQEAAYFFGALSARGGSQGGNGGFAELSAPYLIKEGLADLRAPQGFFGSLLIDPTDVVISSSATTGGVDLMTDPVTLPVQNTVTINNTDLTNQLQMSNVTITTVGSGGSGPNDGSISVNASVGSGGTWTAATTFSLTAASSITIAPLVSISNTSATTGFTAIDFTANGTTTQDLPGIQLGSSSSLTTNGGDIVLDATLNTAPSSFKDALEIVGEITTNTGDIYLTGIIPPGSNSSGRGISVRNISSSSGNITITGATSSNATGSGTSGVSIQTPWNPGTTGEVHFLNCFGSEHGFTSHGVSISNTGSITHAGDLFFTNCRGGNNTSASAGNGLNISRFDELVLDIGGNLVGSDLIGQGNSSTGFLFSTFAAIISVDGSIDITASSTGTSGPCRGISLSGGLMRTTAGGALNLNGTGGVGGASSFGIILSGSGIRISTATGGGNVSLTGTGQGSSDNHGIYMGSSNIDVTSGSVSLTGNVTPGAGSAGIFLLGNLITNGGSISLSGTTFLSGSNLLDTTNGGASPGGASIILNGPIDSNFASAYSLTLNAGGGPGSLITFGAPIGGTSPLSAFTCLSPLNGASSLTCTATTATFNEAVGSATPLTGLSITASAIEIYADQSVSGGSMTYDGPVTLFGNATFSKTGSGAVTFEDTLSGNFNATVTAPSATVTFNGALGSATPLTGLSITASAIEIHADQTVSGSFMTYDGPVTLFGNATFSKTGSGAVTFEDTLSGNFNAIFTAPSATVTFNGAVGSPTPLASLSITASAIEIYADQTVSGGSMIYDGPVTLFGNTTFSKTGSGAITFEDTLSGNFNAIVTAPSAAATFGDTIDLTGALGSGASGGSFTATAGGSVTLEGALLTYGASSAGAGGSGGNVAISSTNGSISVHNIYTYGGAGTSTGQGGNITLTPSSAYSGSYPAGLIILNEDLGVEGNLVATLALNGAPGAVITLDAGRSSYPSVATIVSSLAGNDITLIGETIEMGENEALTALGSLSIEGSTLTLSDLVALETMTLSGDTINLLEHGDVPILLSSGGIGISSSLHWQSGGSYTRTGVLNPPDGIIDDKSLSLSPGAFLPLLTFESHILNYDGDTIPLPSGTGEAEKQFMIYSLSVADAELSDSLPPIVEEPLKQVEFRPRSKIDQK